MSSPTQRTLKLLRDAGLKAQVVEKWIPQTRQRKDLFDCIDLVALDARAVGVLGVQACSGCDHSKRVKKVLASPLAKLWVACGNRLAVYSWSKRGPLGKAKRWMPRVEEIMLGMFPEAP